MNSITIPISEVTKSIRLSVSVTGVKPWRIRLKIATWLIFLATKIAGIGFEVKA